MSQKLQGIHCDNGTELVNEVTRKYIESIGARFELSIPGFPQQNGIAERSDRTILDGARALLPASGLAQQYLGYVIQCFVYLNNRLPTVWTGELLTPVPLEAFWGRRLTLKHVKIFGCTDYGKRDKKSK